MNEIQQVIKVGIADLKVVKAPQLVRTSGLGSCVGVVVYDLVNKIAGMAHVMLPDSALAKQREINPYKYADTAMDNLIDSLIKAGAKKRSLRAKMAGGSQMFQFAASSQLMRIGPRNVQALQKKLDEYQIAVMATDVGGNNGRTIEFNPVTGILKVRTVNKGESFI